MSVIPATQEAEIRRIEIQSQPRQIVCETLSQKNPSKNRASGVAQGEVPEFKPQYLKKKKKKKARAFIMYFHTPFIKKKKKVPYRLYHQAPLG
jgi:hypothetical protein